MGFFPPSTRKPNPFHTHNFKLPMRREVIIFVKVELCCIKEKDWLEFFPIVVNHRILLLQCMIWLNDVGKYWFSTNLPTNVTNVTLLSLHRKRWLAFHNPGCVAVEPWSPPLCVLSISIAHWYTNRLPPGCLEMNCCYTWWNDTAFWGSTQEPGNRERYWMRGRLSIGTTVGSLEEDPYRTTTQKQKNLKR